MRLTGLFCSATLALTASAFLIPLEISDKVSGSHGSLIPGADKQTVKLRCTDCPVALEAGSPAPQKWPAAGQGFDSELILDFAVQNGQVNLNGVPIYPPNAPAALGLRAKQSMSDDNVRLRKEGVSLSTSIELRPTEAIIGKDGAMKVHPIALEIMGLDDHVVELDTVRILVAEDAEGKFMLLPIETAPYQHSAVKDACGSILCRIRYMIVSKIAALRAAAAARFGFFRTSCMKKGGQMQGHRGPHVKGGPNKFSGHRRPHGHMAHGRHHRFRHALRRIIRHVILPIFFGITAGMVVGAFSMLVWTAIASIANRVRGTKSPNYESVAQAEDGRAASFDGPPKYEEVYTEPEEDVTDEKRQLL